MHAIRQAEARVNASLAAATPRIAIESVTPQVEGGRFAAKCLVGQPLAVDAVIFTDGHDQIAAALLWRGAGEQQWQRVPLQAQGNDRWRGWLVPEAPGRAEFVIEAWQDIYASYHYELKKKYAAGVPVALEIQEGEALVRRIGAEAPASLAERFAGLFGRLADCETVDQRVAVLLDPLTSELMGRAEHRPHLVRSGAFPLDVDRKLAEFASWYELFPRSESGDPQRHGTFADVQRRLPDIAAMGFDVLYFPPIHPIGRTHRKGPNNSLKAGPNDPGSPYAIGSAEGGHEAVHPELGSLEDFRDLVQAARNHGLEVALDFAIQCSPDHPWLEQHPGWFSWRPDGTIRHAENPPKKYEDIVNVDFYAEAAVPDLWMALLEVVQGWVEQGVTLFRVDNPHTKPMPFWEWLIAEVRRANPEVIFLSEAFTRPAMMARLGKLGFAQSYTYFTWRNSKKELEEYFAELNQSPWRECYRPNFFVNTPDINPYFLHHGGRAGFLIRAALATMGSGLWGMYSGFELCEAAPVPGKEEYLDSEKYQLRPRDYHAPGNIVGEITRLNQIRRDNRALHSHFGFQAYNAWNDNILFFGKRTAERDNFILVAVSLDPHNAQEANFELPLWEFGLADDAALEGEDLMNGHRWTWHGKVQWMRIEPWHLPFGIWRVRPVR
ncbi:MULTISPECIES: alpha-1,4-glucan--maltose-1-phosphate maltosyltransferase [unclassified Pseudomonas]|uniref:alpha-1,4-glucan--maltose-1-phosphate maltosyltransferase n=1 Tax=unclassified Pseudomonas TaxID=196821 RepID=UPI00244702A9|nr:MULTISPECIES: alpha-1,4-glucan--maltose-1-phosphate maltosyltransferase [unclassified Pseudomonas]MDG9924222.1 alpha-1,4-glucan--maltose-1-phosphate maltosyltransferase [Pseudomonas sp. GD04045]MDH0036652.1 alpha-1,4-glucan--maltose-1-phosphate maltosyltransferase [Pseudomonas sp. GD04019]